MVSMSVRIASARTVRRRPKPRHGNALTQRQHHLMTFIVAYIDRYGYAPMAKEMAADLGGRSHAAVSQLLARIEDKGWIRRGGGSSRAIQVLRKPETTARSPTSLGRPQRQTGGDWCATLSIPEATA